MNPNFQDRELTCKECGSVFVFTAEEQEFYQSRGFEYLPGRCPACRVAREARQLGDLRGFRGTPEIRVLLGPVNETLVENRLPWPATEVLGLAPIEAEPACWLVALRDGSVCRLDPAGHLDDVCSIDLPPGEPDAEAWLGHVLTPRLHASFDGAFAAIVNDYGKFGRVYDLRTGDSTIELVDGVDDRPDTVPFSFAFVEHQGRTVAIHRTAWNRLDASDAATGRLLTERRTCYGRGEEDREHYLDYFHGGLVVSPSGQWIADDGWVWHPVGMPTVWDLSRWLDANVWESEDGPSLMSLAYRAYCWDAPICWLDDDRIALWGIGDDDERMVAGARIFTTGEPGSSSGPFGQARELGAFAGPSGRFFGDGGRLFSASDHTLSIWDVDSGALVSRIDGFEPSWQHLSGRELVEISDHRLRRWRY